MDKVRNFLIESEDQAWELLSGILANSIILDETVTLEFKNWPIIEFKVQGRRWQSSMPTRIMPPILELQKDLYRAYARVHYGGNDIRRLNDDEREALEIIVKVSQGSSEFMALIEGAMNTFVDGAVTKMTSEHMLITVLGVALVVAGRLGWKDWLNTRLQEKESDDRVKLSQEETRRLEVMSKAMQQQPMIQQLKEEVELTKDQLVKSLNEPDQIEFGEVTLLGSEAKALVKKERERSKPVRVDGLFRIQEVRPQVASFRLGLKRISDGMELHAEAKDQVLNYDMREALKQGEWGRIPIEFSINAYELRGNIINAEVFSVNIPKDKN